MSLAALRSALAELDKNGKGCTLVENQTPRAYYSNQAGLGPAPYVIKLQGARYDIGLYKAEDGKGYEARTDFWNKEVENIFGAPASSATSAEQAKLGQLFQMYAVHATMEEARKNGHQCRRIKGKDGVEQVIITGV